MLQCHATMLCRALKEAVSGSFHRSQIPQLDVPITGNLLVKQQYESIEQTVAQAPYQYVPTAAALLPAAAAAAAKPCGSHIVVQEKQ